jgi:hypothetical protein
MELIQSPNFCIEVSEHFYQSWEDTFDIEREVKKQTERFLKRKTFRQLCRLNADRLVNERVKVLKVHGVSNPEGRFLFHDGKKLRSVQRWIDENDGRASVLVIMGCNPHGRTIVSKQSIVLHPKGKISECALQTNHSLIRMYVPNIGYVENDRCLLRQAFRELE